MKVTPEGHGVLVAVLTAVAFTFMAFGVAQSQISNNKEALAEVRKTQDEDHDILLRIHSDVKWIINRITDGTRGK